MKIEIGAFSCECPHCNGANSVLLGVETMTRSYVVRCSECVREFMVTAIEVRARFEGGSSVQCVTAETSKECR